MKIKYCQMFSGEKVLLKRVFCLVSVVLQLETQTCLFSEAAELLLGIRVPTRWRHSFLE